MFNVSLKSGKWLSSKTRYERGHVKTSFKPMFQTIRNRYDKESHQEDENKMVNHEEAHSRWYYHAIWLDS